MATYQPKNISLDGDALISVAMSSFDPSRITLLFLHGLGDSSLAWKELFEAGRFDRYNLIAPDLAGFGGTASQAGQTFGFADQLRLVGKLLDKVQPDKLVIIGHSMSGVMGGWLTAALLQATGKQECDPLFGWTGLTSADLLPQDSLRAIELCGFVSVEGTLVVKDASISRRAIDAWDRGMFDRWFKAFLKSSTGPQWLKENPGITHYQQSVRSALPEAFHACAADLDAWKQLIDNSDVSHSAHLLLQLQLPVAYLYGSESVHPKALELLSGSSIEAIGFAGAGHWLMNQQNEKFQVVLEDLLERWVK